MKRYAILLLLILALNPPRAVSQTIQMRVPDTSALLGTTIDIPIYADTTLTGKNVFSYTIQISYNASYVQFIAVVTAGTISNAFGAPAVNSATPGMITMAGAGTSPLTGKGKFIYLRMKGLTLGGSGIYFTGPNFNFFNEGIPAMSLDNGSITSTAPPSITVYPDNGLITKGEQIQFNVSGGTPPYQYSLTNPAVATITTGGLLTGTQAGFTRVAAQDFNGLKDTTNLVEIRAMRLTIPNNLSQWQGAYINVPVSTTDMTGLGVVAGSFALTYDPNILTPAGIVQTGTLLASYSAPAWNSPSPGTLNLSFAGSTPIAGSGTLIYIRFLVSTLHTGGTGLNFASGLFNENLIPNFTNGYFSTINLPVLTILPSSGSLVAGMTQQFTLSGGGIPPIQWSCSDTSVATISPSGLLTTKKGGIIHVYVADSVGATANSGNWLIYDTRVYMPDTTTCAASTVFYYPIRITALPPGESVVSVQARVNFDATYFDFQTLETIGTLTPGWTWVANPQTGQVSLAGSGTTGFSSAGFIIKLKFLLKAPFTLYTTGAINLQEITLNEGVPNPWTDTYGTIQRTTATVPAGLSISASPSNTICSGMSVTFTATPVNGGIPSFQWKLNSGNITGATNQTYTTNTLANGNVITCVMTTSDPCVTGSPVTSNTITMNVGSFPLPAPTITGTATSCEGTTGVTYTTEAGMTGYTWAISPGGSITAGGNTRMITVSWNVQGSQWVSVNYANANGCMAATATVKNVSVSAVPGPAGTISGITTVFQSQTSVAYSVPAVPLATGYTWTLPTGASIASGSNTNSILADYAATASSGSFQVKATNYCGDGAWSRPLPVTVVSTFPMTVGVQNRDIAEGQSECYFATQTLTVAGGGAIFIVEPGASATLMAGMKISLLPGTKVKYNGYLHAYINRTGPYCSSPGLPTTMGMGGTTIFPGQSNCYPATQKITVGGNGNVFTVQSGATANLVAGQSVSLLYGTRAITGSYFRARITTNGSYCGTKSAQLVSNEKQQPEGNPFVTVTGKNPCVAYPNPTTGLLHLRMEPKGVTEFVWIEVYGITGNRILRITRDSGSETVLDLGNQPPGIYLLKVVSASRSETVKVVRE
ncbi:MAG TPA: cohesin domain-containing protein [Bacteroidales bacterium]|nr:cohesin domain-containing protein [Bacteroidales bacterium]